MDIIEAMAQAAMQQHRGDEGPPKKPGPQDHSVQIENLREHAERYRADCPFVEGDVVVPRRTFNIRGAGRPHVVVKVLETPVYAWECPALGKGSDGGSGDTSLSYKLDMVVACYPKPEERDVIASWLVGSWQYEIYKGDE